VQKNSSSDNDIIWIDIVLPQVGEFTRAKHNNLYNLYTVINICGGLKSWH
jgi:hypothetical protein